MGISSLRMDMYPEVFVLVSAYREFIANPRVSLHFSMHLSKREARREVKLVKIK